jgi:phosphoesterase RecJ-like protein
MMTIRETAHWLNQHDHFLILTHRRPDGDTLGCAAGLAQGLRNAGKTAFILHNPETTARYLPYVKTYWAPEGYAPAHIIAVDIASEDLFPLNGKEYLGRVALCIDHHPSNTQYAAQTCLNAEKASCGEIVYALLLALVGGISADIAAALYVAVSTDTGCFAYVNTNADTLRAAADLTDAGAPIGDINRALFRTKAKSRVLLEAMIITNMEFYHDGAVAVVIITRDMMRRAGAGENEMDDVAAIPGAIEGVIAGITIRELTGPGDSKVSVRTTPLVNANALCAHFGGGGHATAAGFSLDASVEETKRRLLEALDELFPLGRRTGVPGQA